MPTEFTKEIASSTAKVYKSQLNKLAKYGFDTVAMIQTQQKKVIAAIKANNPGNDEASRHKRRIILSAIFWAVPLPEKNQYHVYWQTTTPLEVIETGARWVKKQDYDA